jgi:hypothetical protein
MAKIRKVDPERLDERNRRTSKSKAESNATKLPPTSGQANDNVSASGNGGNGAPDTAG